MRERKMFPKRTCAITLAEGCVWDGNKPRTLSNQTVGEEEECKQQKQTATSKYIPINEVFIYYFLASPPIHY